MVDDFSRFARMPKPVIEGEDVADTVRRPVFLMRVGHPTSISKPEIKEEPMRAQFDRRLISQALTNITKTRPRRSRCPGRSWARGVSYVIAARENDES